MGIITTRTISESVFGAQLLKATREQGLDIDSIAEHMHQPDQLPSKQDQPVEFMKPLINLLIAEMKKLQPARRQNAAVAQVQNLQKQLSEAQAQLAEMRQHNPSAASKRPPPLMQSTPKKKPRSQQLPLAFQTQATGSDDPTPREPSHSPPEEDQPIFSPTPDHQEDLGDEVPQPDTVEPISQYPPTQPQTGLGNPYIETSSVPDSSSRRVDVKTMLNPERPTLSGKVISGYSDPTVKKFVQTFPEEVQQSSLKLIETLNQTKVTKEQLITAAKKYGVKAELATKMYPKTLTQLIALGAALTS